MGMSRRFCSLALSVSAYLGMTAGAWGAEDMSWLLAEPPPEPLEWLVPQTGGAVPPQAAAELGAPLRALAQDLGGPGTPGVKTPGTLVFISLGMPAATLRGLLAEGAGREDVAFVLRGWEPPELAGLIARVRALMPSAQKGSEPSVLIHPGKFRSDGVRHVPVFLDAGQAGGVRRIDGEISLAGAEALFAAEAPLPDGPVGPLYEIEEPDILEIARARIQAEDWQGRLDEARERARRGGMGVELPTASEDRVYWVRTETRVNRDISLPDGRVVAAAGALVNPLEHMRLRHRYVFFDPENPRQLEVVRSWQREHDNLRLIASRIDPLGEEIEALAAELGQPVFPSNALLLERFGVRETPALAEQDGTRIKVTIKRPLMGG